MSFEPSSAVFEELLLNDVMLQDPEDDDAYAAGQDEVVTSEKTASAQLPKAISGLGAVIDEQLAEILLEEPLASRYALREDNGLLLTKNSDSRFLESKQDMHIPKPEMFRASEVRCRSQEFPTSAARDMAAKAFFRGRGLCAVSFGGYLKCLGNRMNFMPA